jgi:hypothetical protein
MNVLQKRKVKLNTIWPKNMVLETAARNAAKGLVFVRTTAEVLLSGFFPQ